MIVVNAYIVNLNVKLIQIVQMDMSVKGVDVYLKKHGLKLMQETIQNIMENVQEEMNYI